MPSAEARIAWAPMMSSPDTIAAPATPNGTAGIAVLRVSGPDTEFIGKAIFGTLPRPRQMRHGDYRDQAGGLLDDVMFVFFAGPHSYTGEDAMEISCHGNPFIVQRIFEDLLARGCRAAEPGEFTRRAFLNGRMDLSQAEAVVDVIHARSERALTAAQQQLRGALGRRVRDVVERLVHVIAQVEAYIDFPEEDLPAEDRRQIFSQIAEIKEVTDRMLATDRYGAILRDGVRTVILGAPNVGKSSLLNRFLGHERALVSAQPGTTRDFIEEKVIIGPHCFRLVDTAGLNETPAPLEKLGMAKTMERVDEADIFLLVRDGSNPALPRELENLKNDPRAIHVINKADLLAGCAHNGYNTDNQIIMVSARTGRGWDALCRALVEKADSFQSELSEADIAIGARHAQALGLVTQALGGALVNLEADAPVELLASDLRAALVAMGEIAGRVDNERVLDALFASFCIGK